MPELSSDLLQTFLAVAETGLVTEGAARIYRSQSAASIQIKKLETVLGRPVFNHHGRGVVLTEIGRRLLPIARDVASTLDVTYRCTNSDIVVSTRSIRRRTLIEDKNNHTCDALRYGLEALRGARAGVLVVLSLNQHCVNPTLDHQRCPDHRAVRSSQSL